MQLKSLLETGLPGRLVSLKIGRLLGRALVVGGILAISYRRMLSSDWLLKGLPNLWDQSVQTGGCSAMLHKCI